MLLFSRRLGRPVMHASLDGRDLRWGIRPAGTGRTGRSEPMSVVIANPFPGLVLTLGWVRSKAC